MENDVKSKLSKGAVGLIAPCVLVIIWQISYDNHWLPPSQSASPLMILKATFSLVQEMRYFGNLGLSITRLFLGVIIGGVIGISFGILTSTQLALRSFLGPSIQFLGGVPVVVWIPFWIMVFGIGESLKVGLISISSFFLVYGGVYQSILSIDREYLELALLYRKSFPEKIRRIFIPYSLYAILGAIRLSLMIGWVVLFFAEYSISSEGKEGIGWFIANARSVGKIEEEFVGLLTLGIVAFIIDLIISVFQKRSIEWKS